MPGVVLPCMLSKGDDGMPCPTSSDRVCCPRAMMECHAPLLQCVSHKGNNDMPCLMSSDRMCYPRAMWACHGLRGPIVCVVQGDDNMPHTTSSDRVCFPMAMMTFHARHRQTVYTAQRQWLHAKLDFLRPCVLPKNHAGMPCPTLSNPVFCLLNLVIFFKKYYYIFIYIQSYKRKTRNIISFVPYKVKNERLVQCNGKIDKIY